MALARELGLKGITAKTVSPDFIDETGMTAEFDTERVGPIASQIPLQRPGRGEDIANEVGWQTSAQADHVTGMTLPVNGGWRFY
ncbi:SDR family oxidoreductase [Aromatoleum petrolei]|uniref:SDR family oxidoreductase n=1 Tax=Aromatoleum petrolei TaxID=76116 RepID=A0ABX1MGF0_9RHOO|nr:SDR family oxidoreductase [Aromatoleum petrolei]NMF87019.1 SDR family oxidoreductase [Aromatoleum petrolei]QTQ34754.1 putative NAD(P)-binding domain superfamily protein [Aromatoleum petrolei]